MLVYRVCFKEEADYILNNLAFKDVGGTYYSSEFNNHVLDGHSNYMFFYPEKPFILYRCPPVLSYICTYDIPDSILAKCEGIGYYYIYRSKRIDIKEYAIESKKMKFEYLQKIEILLTELNFCDLARVIADGLEVCTTDVIYKASKQIIRERKKEEESS